MINNMPIGVFILMNLFSFLLGVAVTLMAVWPRRK